MIVVSRRKNRLIQMERRMDAELEAAEGDAEHKVRALTALREDVRRKLGRPSSHAAGRSKEPALR